MTPQEVSDLANKLLGEHGLVHWTFRFDRAKKRLGHCVHNHQYISLSIHYIEGNTEWMIRDTILHEIAHALVGARHKHDDVWKAMCLKIGALPNPCKVAVMPEGRVEYQCPACDKILKVHKSLRRKTACGSCCKIHNQGKFTEQFLFQRVMR